MWSDRNVSELLEGAVKEEKKGSLARKEREDKMLGADEAVVWSCC